MNKHIPIEDHNHPVPLAARPEAIIMRDRLASCGAITEILSQDLGKANKILNWMACQSNLLIEYKDGRYKVITDNGYATAQDFREAILTAIKVENYTPKAQ